ncbi:low-density lipoprotein receptor-like [Crassostrea angulata]|uniref:low-density lipoprotein receptor-like n=1 Tax=Magallana angulata TaxID=2784310 RepID=UPI0022B1D50A|nr:low-density lipoprotein receptor-like [Crassostrea angulata]
MLLLYLGIIFAIAECVHAQSIPRCFILFGVDTCDEGYRCHEGQCIPDNGQSNPCFSDLDCSRNERCENRRCVTRGRMCTSDLECSINEQCRNRRCIPRRQFCRYDFECSRGERCESGTCVRRGKLCRYDFQCLSNERCENRRCVSREEVCTFDFECPYGYCNRGICEGRDHCTNDFECPGNQRCENGKCVSRGELCTDDYDCPGNQRCENGRCVSRGEVCTFDFQCLLFPNGRCRRGRCFYNTTSSVCRSHYECPNGWCNGGICEDIFPTTPTPTLCYPNTNRPCPLGYRCRRGICEEDVPTLPNTCRSSRDCQRFHQCLGGRCVPRIVIG